MDPLVWHGAWSDVAAAAVGDAVARLPFSVAARVLDVGTGSGIALPALASRAAYVLAIDTDARLVETAAERARRVGAASGVECRISNVESLLDGPDRARFDVVWAGDVLWRNYFPDPASTVRGLSRLLRPGGTLAIFTGSWFASRFMCGHADLERRVQAASARRWGVPADGDPAHQEQAGRWLVEGGLADVQVSMHPIIGACGTPGWESWRRYLEVGVWPDYTASTRDHGEAGDSARLTTLVTPGLDTYLPDQAGYVGFQPAMLMTGRPQDDASW